MTDDDYSDPAKGPGPVHYVYARPSWVAGVQSRNTACGLDAEGLLCNVGGPTNCPQCRLALARMVALALGPKR